MTSRIGELASSTSAPKMESKSVMNIEIKGAGILRVGAKTIPTVCCVSKVVTVTRRHGLLTVSCSHLVDLGVVDDVDEEECERLDESEVADGQSVHQDVE